MMLGCGPSVPLGTGLRSLGKDWEHIKRPEKKRHHSLALRWRTTHQVKAISFHLQSRSGPYVGRKVLRVARHGDATRTGNRAGNFYQRPTPVSFFMCQCCVSSDSAGFEQ